MLSLKFNNVYISDYDAIVGPNEKKGNLKNIKKVISDFYYKEKSFELAQIKMQKDIINSLESKDNKEGEKLIIGGDLTNQISGTTYGLKNDKNSFLGIYCACSTFIEGLIISSLLVDNNYINSVINITSSHNLVAERQFRYPVEYGVIRNVNSTFTATGCVGCIIKRKKSNIKIVNATIGSIIDKNISDPNEIGAIMAPAAAEVIYNHLINNHINIDYYDLILTGDLGSVGTKILKTYLFEKYNLNGENISDAGAKIYKKISDINDGASGPSVLPLYFFYNIIPNKKYKKVLLVGTGSLHSKSMVNQKESVPAVAHAVGIELKI